MNPAQKALWYIESHLAAPLTLDDVAGVAGVSRFHLVRAFATATGFSVMRYVRARRLTKAAQALAAGAPDILSLALDADYSSHEAFTRAFRDHFGVTPEMVRATTCLDRLKLVEPIVMDSTPLDNLKPPRFEISKPAVSQHLAVLENAGLVTSEKRGQFIYYRLVPESLANTLNSYVQEVCPVSRPIKRESRALKASKT